jgi:hypothetical protein
LEKSLLLGVVEAVVETSERQAFDVEGLPRGYIYTHTHLVKSFKFFFFYYHFQKL